MNQRHTHLPLLALLILLCSMQATASETLRLEKKDGPFVHYAGAITVSGKYEHRTEDEMIGDVLCFFPKGPSAKLIPRGKDDRRLSWFCFKDQATAKAELKVLVRPPAGSCGFSGQATIVISGYVVDLRETETYDTARLDRVVSSTAPKAILCEP